MNRLTHREMLHEALTGGGRYPKAWGEKVALVRETLGLGRADLAKRAGCDYTTIRKVERGDMSPSDHLKCGIASALATPVDRLFAMPTLQEINDMHLEDEAAAA